MTYVVRKVAELTAAGSSEAACTYYNETITFSANVADTEWICLVLATKGGGNIPGFPITRLDNVNIDGTIVGGDYCNGGAAIPHSSADYFGGVQTGIVGPNPMSLITQPRPLLGPIAMGDTATIKQLVSVGGTSTFRGYQAMIVAITTVPALDHAGGGTPLGDGCVDGCPDFCVGGVAGQGPGNPNLTSTTQRLTGYGGQNPSPSITGPCGRTSSQQLLIAAFAAYTLTPPTYSGTGWTEELSTNDGVGIRIGFAVKELTTTGDFSDNTVIATWGAPENGSGVLLQLAEDVPPAIHLAHRLGFDN